MTERDRMLRRLHAEPRRSRNQHFDELSQPAAVQARRSLKRLVGLTRELRAGGMAELVAREGGYELTIRFPSVRAQRTAWLTREEHALLVEDEDVRAILAAKGHERAA